MYTLYFSMIPYLEKTLCSFHRLNYSSTREFELPTRGLDFVTLVFELVTHGFVLVTHGFKLVTRELELAIQGFKLATRKF